jgi:hypothetical protein
MKIILIIRALIGVHSTTNQVREFIETPNGLVWRHPSTATSFGSDEINSQNPINFLDRITTDPLRSLFSIVLDRRYTSRNNSTMILPPSESHPFFRMIENPIDPATYCFEGTIGIVDITPNRFLGFNAGIELIPGPNDSNSTRVRMEAATGPYPFSLSTNLHFDVIPPWVHYRLLSAILRLGVQTADDENINQLPTIQYTIYRSSRSDEIVARIISEPRDYLNFTPEGMRLMVKPQSNGNRLQLGLNTLKHIGVLLDYEHHQIGFCEPI